MARQFSHFYLQRSTGSAWETMQESESVAALTSGISDRLVVLGDAEIRIIGAKFDDQADAWSYEQLFYIDPATVDLGVAGLDGDRATTAPNAPDAPAARNPGSDSEEEMFSRLWSMNRTEGRIDDLEAPSRPDVAAGAGVAVGPAPMPARPAIVGASAHGGLEQVNMRLAYLALVLGGIIAALSFGIRSGFGLYLAPISLEFGYGREVFAFSLALQNLVWGVTQPFAGAFADRYGATKAIAFGAVLYSVGTIMLSFSDTPGLFHLSAGVLLGAALSGTSFGIILGAVAKLFPPEKRSWALGITGAAGSLGQFLIVPAGQRLLESVGWSNSAFIMGFVALLMLPLSLVFLKAKPAMAVGTGPTQTLRQALREALGYPSFWFLAGGFFVCGFHVAYIAVHLPSFVVDIGLSAQTGAWALGLVGLFNVIGSYSAGVLGGRFSKKYLLSMLYFGRAVVMTGFLLLPPSELVVYVFAATMGLLWLSTVPLTSGLVADMFGPRYMTTLFGIVFLSHQIGGFLGAWLGGFVFDATGSYQIVWWVSVALALFAGFMHWPIREQPVARLSTA